MRFYPLFKKSIIENFRDWKILILGLTFAPFFVILMYLYFGEAKETYQVVIVNHDKGVAGENGKFFLAGKTLISEIERFTDSERAVSLKVFVEKDMIGAQKRLRNKSADLIVEIPDNFSQIIMDYKRGETPAAAVVRTYGDPANPKYIMAAAWSDSLAFRFTAERTGLQNPLEFETEVLSEFGSVSDFDLYIPALLALALMMLMFTAAATFIKEKDKGTIIRLRISNMTTTEWLSAVSLTQVIIGMVAVGLTYLTAITFGYRTEGSLPALAVVSALSCVAMIAISVLVASLLRTIFDLMTIGCFPFFVLMFFSGGMFPIPALKLFALGGYTIHVNDLLPTTHTITAYGKILNHGARLDDVIFETGAILILSVFYFASGIWLFTKRHMRAK